MAGPVNQTHCSLGTAGHGGIAYWANGRTSVGSQVIARCVSEECGRLGGMARLVAMGI